jgi:hypothetical protein
MGSVLTKCQPCRAGGTSPRRCRGWRISLKGLTALRFELADVHGRLARVTIEGIYDFQHSEHARRWPDWTAAPMSHCSSVIYVEEALSETPLTRQHLDLANREQAGPVWHLQLGGLPSEGARPTHEWLDVPRWPSHPLDFALTVELTVYNFFSEAWSRLKTSNPWRLWIHRSEELVLSHYHQRFSDYWNRRTDLDSWLATQCNQSSGWDPRPS